MAANPELLERITVRPEVLGGKPIIRDMRMAVEHVLGKLALGETPETIVEQYEFLEPEDIQACLLYAHRAIAAERVYAWKQPDPTSANSWFSREERDMATDSDLLKRITVRPEAKGGKPAIRDMRISVERVLEMMSEGETKQTILERYDFLEPEDIQACLLFAYRRMSGEDMYDRVTTLPPR